ncbi:uncharacterized protein MYCFIDRAFT_174485 [Pseudocercospora fijiensis CIRAD86]|uniref:Uncharacterized protein n=1 Tax=Pseudocercospora fijiensis (strain CIRAD86) TaxID=383855 RepID=M2ZVF4_PSEFD|nr:uncharacterized protein MYCFIDRAFT_174485 [Pseudocercospora fijiensis CIRAD86]EME82984.1 hypothetical protein MYCFIDRAFT_174485 [Pseudocercospora fijiensis CIRAD86]
MEHRCSGLLYLLRIEVQGVKPHFVASARHSTAWATKAQNIACPGFRHTLLPAPAEFVYNNRVKWADATPDRVWYSHQRGQQHVALTRPCHRGTWDVHGTGSQRLHATAMAMAMAAHDTAVCLIRRRLFTYSKCELAVIRWWPRALRETIWVQVAIQVSRGLWSPSRFVVTVGGYLFQLWYHRAWWRVWVWAEVWAPCEPVKACLANFVPNLKVSNLPLLGY